MKKFIIVSILVFLALAASVRAGEKKGLLIMLDGLRGDAALSASTPSIDSLRLGTWAEGYHGAYTYEAYTILDANPSSATNHVSIMTGVTATKHGCYNNGQTALAKYDEYPAMSTLIAREKPDTKSAWIYMWDENSDIPTHATYIAPPQPDNKIFNDALSFVKGTFPSKDGIQGSKWNAKDDIDLLMLYIDGPDAKGHAHGFTVTSPEYMNHAEEIDARIGEILTAIKERPNFANEDWLIIVNSDHGGFGRGHGIPGSQNCYTVPFFATAKDLVPGRMKGDPRNCDAAAYMLRHFTGKIPEHFDAKINDVFPIEEKALTDNLIAYLPFEGDSNAAVGDLSGRVSLVPHDYVTDGKIGKALSLSGSNPVCFGKPAALKFGKERDFTFAFWFRTDKIQKGSAAILGNKNWNDCFQAGIVVTANVGSDEGNKLAFNLGDAVNHHDINPLEYAPDGQWHFAAITADRDGDAILYLGLPDGNLAFIAERLGNFGDIDNMNWYLGQDGTGTNPAAFVGDIDELMVWDRVLFDEEIYKLFHHGLAGNSVLK